MDWHSPLARSYRTILAIVALTVCAASIGCQTFPWPTVDAAGNPILPVGGPQYAAAPAYSPATAPAATFGNDLPPATVDTAAPSLSVTSGPLPCPPAATFVAPPPPGPPLLAGGCLGDCFNFSYPTQMMLTPSQMVAPVGSEVVLIASVSGDQGRPTANKRVEWMLSPESVGQFYNVGDEGNCFALRWPRNTPKKMDNDFAIGSTRSSAQTLTRGTATQFDDLTIQRGQAWINVSSPTEGTSYVTAHAPQVAGWAQRQQTATIHWIDAQFNYAAPAIIPVGTQHTFTTTVTRLSDGSPIEGWLVKYQITDGSDAGFAPSNTTEVEVPTDSSGAATVQIVQRNPQRGTNKISIQVSRPGGLPGMPGAGRRLVLGNGGTTVTWTAPEVALRVTGPATAQVGSLATYRIAASNPGELPVADAFVQADIPAGTSFSGSNPSADQSPSGLAWRLGNLAPGETREIEVDLKVERSGVIRFCAEMTARDNLSAQDCADTAIDLAPLDLTVMGPESATVGQELDYRFVINNRTAQEARDLKIRIALDPGMAHVDANVGNPIERDVGTIAAGDARRDIGVPVRVSQPGRLCMTIEITGPDVRTTQKRICVAVRAQGAGLPSQPQRAALTVTKEVAGANRITVGDSVDFRTTVRNTGETTLRNLVVTHRYDAALQPVEASAGNDFTDEGISWTLAELAPGASELFDTRCRAVVDVARTCGQVEVTGDGQRQTAEACVEILAAAGERPEPMLDPTPSRTDGDVGAQPPANIETGGLSVAIVDINDEIAAGQNVTYKVSITNNRTQSDMNVEVSITLPEGMTVASVDPNNPSKHRIEGRILRFGKIAELRANREEEYSFALKANQPGQHRIDVRVTSDAERQPVMASEQTNVFAQ